MNELSEYFLKYKNWWLIPAAIVFIIFILLVLFLPVDPVGPITYPRF